MTEPKPETKAAKPKGYGDERAVTTTLEEATEAGLLGAEVDPTPNRHYTVAGVTSGAPTPETDERAAEAVRRAAAGG